MLFLNFDIHQKCSRSNCTLSKKSNSKTESTIALRPLCDKHLSRWFLWDYYLYKAPSMGTSIIESVEKLPVVYIILAIALIPIYILCLTGALILRCLVHVYLSCFQPGYAGLLNIFDLFFDHEHVETRSNITTMAMIKLTNFASMEEVRQEGMKIGKIVLSNKSSTKLRSVIKEWRGFRFWQKVDIDLEKQLQMFEARNEKEVKDFWSKVSNEPIYDDRMWEIFFGSTSIDGLYPVILKGHHSVADGYGFRDVLVGLQTSQLNNAANDTKTLEQRIRSFKSTVANIFNLLMMGLCAPLWCITQYLTPKDRNSFRAKKLSSRKQIGWKKANFQKIKDIQKPTGYSFSEVILAAVSKSLSDVLESRNDRHDSHVTLVFPHRRSRASSGLENEFVLAPLKLPVLVQDDRRELAVATTYRALERVPGYRLNYFTPRMACLLFPWRLPKWAYEATEFTALVSNFPGPKTKIVFDGFECESCAFVVPNIADNNGLGITMVSYDGQYLVASIIDEAVAQTSDDADNIAQGIVKYIDETHKKLCS